MRPSGLLLAIGLALLAVPAATPADRGLPQSPLADLLEVIVLEREVLALDAESGGQTREALEIGERVLWQGSRGRVAMVLTNRRVLAVGVGSGAWQSTRYRSAESPPTHALLGDRVGLVVTEQRLVGFDGGSGNLIERSLGPREAILSTGVGENVAVVATDRRALGLSPFQGGFFQARLRLGERLESLSARSNHATLTTSRRLLIFRASSGTWEERRLDLR